MSPNTCSRRESIRQEGGQVLVMFGLLIGVLILFVMTVVDVGFFIHERQKVQAAADAAALAAAQELPGDSVLAEAIALDYVQANGVDPGDVDISFACITESVFICDEAAGIYDTIYVTPTSTAPAFLGGILNVFGAGDSCWVDGCDVDATAGACRGACGPIGFQPADIAVILDHSYSMSSSDLSESKGAILSMFENFNHEHQQVATVLTPPVEPGDYCDPINDWDDPMLWMSSGLTDQFQTSPHTLNYFNAAVDSIDCVARGGPPGYHTNLGDPMQAAMNELVANGRPDVNRGIILVTDGAANVAPSPDNSSSTGQHFCDNQAAVTSESGDNNGYESSGSAACDNGGGYASDNNSGTSTSTSCDSTNKDRHDFWDFDITSSFVGNETVTGIEVRLDAWTSWSWFASRKMCVQLSWDGGNSWTSAKSVSIGSSQQAHILGGSTDDWGHSWTTAGLTNGAFRLRVTSVSSSTSTDFRLDAVAVNVHFVQPGGYEHSGPCDWAAYWADQAKALDIELYIIAWGVTDKCSFDDPDSDYYYMDAAEFLESLASDSFHFFNEPKSADLDPVFYSIGSQLTGGSRLIQ